MKSNAPALAGRELVQLSTTIYHQQRFTNVTHGISHEPGAYSLEDLEHMWEPYGRR